MRKSTARSHTPNSFFFQIHFDISLELNSLPNAEPQHFHSLYFDPATFFLLNVTPKEEEEWEVKGEGWLVHSYELLNRETLPKSIALPNVNECESGVWHSSRYYNENAHLPLPILVQSTFICRKPTFQIEEVTIHFWIMASFYTPLFCEKFSSSTSRIVPSSVWKLQIVDVLEKPELVSLNSSANSRRI